MQNRNTRKKLKKILNVLDKVSGTTVGFIEGLIFGSFALPGQCIAEIMDNKNHGHVSRDIIAGIAVIGGIEFGFAFKSIEGARIGFKGGLKEGCLAAKQLFTYTPSGKEVLDRIKGEERLAGLTHDKAVKKVREDLWVNELHHHPKTYAKLMARGILLTTDEKPAYIKRQHENYEKEKIKKAATVLSQLGNNPASLFSRLPKEMNVRIAASVADPGVLSETVSLRSANKYFKFNQSS